MATLADLTASVQALQSNLDATISDLSAKVSALEAQVDPALLDPLKSSIDAMAAQVKAADPGAGAPAAPTSVGPALFTFTGDPATIDPAAAKADVESPDGQALYTFASVPDPLPAGFSPYSGQVQPAPAPTG